MMIKWDYRPEQCFRLRQPRVARLYIAITVFGEISRDSNKSTNTCIVCESIFGLNFDDHMSFKLSYTETKPTRTDPGQNQGRARAEQIRSDSKDTEVRLRADSGENRERLKTEPGQTH
ncbi:hypothetical protein QTP70_006882 [Hemibagrus guttatus]|uniref:Uncharacterized protein n=1 Tax=Hemibagrus guttatus TaxID=175788 RepID=A0AAE0RGA6_9TELE|nr:hypothetical protein QTP70_006882 [Hemibagrus guttatus]